MEQSTEGLGLGYTPIGPTWILGNYFLGADNQGRDVMARLLYGGRNSLLIAGAATILTLVAGDRDRARRRLFRRLHGYGSFAHPRRPLGLPGLSPRYLALHRADRTWDRPRRDHHRSGSLWLPIFIIGIVYIPYVARPVRGQVLSLRRSEFVLAAIGLGVPGYRILVRDILPNVSTTLVVFVPLMMALNMLTESALSFLSIGVQPPDASWGTIIQDGQGLLYTRPAVAMAGGLAIVLAVLTLNVLGDGLRDALDPRSKVRLGRD